jgi:uncharacterized protein (UPF0332 family)
MTDHPVQTLVRYRLEQAQAALRQARLLADAREWGGAVNRGYYAMFYAALALLVSKGLGSSKHSGVLALVDREFVKPGILPTAHSRAFRRAFGARQKSNGVDGGIVNIQPVTELVQLPGDAGVAHSHLTQADESSHDEDAGANGHRRVQNGGQHDCPVLGECVWWIPPSPTALCDRKLRSQSLRLLGVSRKTKSAGNRSLFLRNCSFSLLVVTP